MRIAMISYHTCPLSAQEGKEIGGMNVYVLSLAKELAKAGQTIDIYTRQQDSTQPLVVDVMPNLRVIHIPAGPQKNVLKEEMSKFTQEFSSHVLSFITQENLSYDVIDCHYYLSGIIGLTIKQKFPSAHFFVTFHTLALMKNLVARDISEKESLERINAELLLVRQATKVISTGVSDAQYLEYLYECPKEKIIVILPGVDTNIFLPIDQTQAKKHIGADLGDKIVLFVGRIEPLKGVDVLLYALKILRQKNPEQKICLWIVGGESKESKKLDEIRQILHIETFVKFVGRQQPEELPYYYNGADLVVMPSHYESFGMTALESMACGTPVIMTDATGVSDFLDEEHAALITSANNPLLLASQMEYLLCDSHARHKLGKNVMEKVQNLSWTHVAKKYQHLLENV